MAKRRLLIWAIVAGVILVASSLIIWATVWRPISRANDYMRAGLALMSPQVEFNMDLHKRLDLPGSIQTRDEAIEFFLVNAAQVDEEQYSGAYLLLGRHYLGKDCEKAERFLDLCLEHSADEQAKELLTVLHSEGCDAAAERAASMFGLKG